jgi:hypothetical protein
LMQFVLQRTPPRGWKEADQTTLNMEEIRRMF